jgi:hypothetical protein
MCKKEEEEEEKEEEEKKSLLAFAVSEPEKSAFIGWKRIPFLWLDRRVLFG